MFLDCMLLLLALRLSLTAVCMYALASIFYLIFTEKEHKDQSKSDSQRLQNNEKNENEDVIAVDDDGTISGVGQGGGLGYHGPAGYYNRLRKRRGQ